MLRVYCDTGAYLPAVGKLEREGKISVHQFKYENRNRKITKGALPSDLRYEDLANYSYDDLGSTEILKDLSYDQLGGVNSRFSEIEKVLGRGNRRDIQHVDSAWMTKCAVLLTSDKGDIWSKRNEIRALLDIVVFHVPTELQDLIAAANSAASYLPPASSTTSKHADVEQAGRNDTGEA